jgi:hypothetical protein
MKSMVKTAMCAVMASMVSAESLYNPLKSTVKIYNNKNFEKQVTLNREKGIGVVKFYKSDDDRSKSDQGQFEKFGIEQNEMLRIGSVECNEWTTICSKEGITEFPTYRVYPPSPIPAIDIVDPSKEVDTDKLKKTAFKFIGNRVIDITQANHDVFKSDNPGKPKVILFTDKKKAPIVFRALSTYFDKTLEFGMVSADEESLAKQYGVKSFPSFFILKHSEKKPIKYTEDTFTYK